MMVIDRFDTLTRSLTTAGSRRRALAALGGALGTALSGSVVDGAAAKKKCPPCKKRKQGTCKKKKPNGSTCPGGTCQGGRCVAVAPPPVPVLAYQCPGPREDTVVSGGGASRIAQSFTAAQSGSLHQIQIEVTKKPGTTGAYVVELLDFGADGKPTNTVLATATIPDAAVPEGDSTLTATFSGPPLVASTEYAVAISRPGGNELQVADRIGNDCAGTAFNQNPIGTGSFQELFAGSRDLVTSVTVLV
jgi:hypothetical protein